MRLLSLTNSYPPAGGGGYAEICADVMEGLASRGHDVTMLTGPAAGVPVAAQRNGVSVRRELTPVLGAWRRPVAARRAERLDGAVLESALRLGVDAALVWHMRGIVKPPLRLLHRAGVPVIYMLHDRWVLYERPGSVFAPWARAEPLAVRTLREPPIEREGIVCFNSSWLRDEHVRLGWRPRESHVVPCGLPAAMAERVRGASPRRGAKRLLFAGRIDWTKGVHDALDALTRLPEATLTIAGFADDPGYGRRLRAQAAELDIAERVEWLGPLTRDALVDAFADHDVLLYPSREPESFGLGILEAQAAGLVAVTSATGGPREFLVDGENCLIHGPGDADGLAGAVERLIADPDLAERLSAAGMRTAEAMPVAAAVDRVEELLA